MPDFTLNTFHRLLATLKDQKYTFQTFAGYLKDPAPRTIILRHDVDARKMNSLKTAQIENKLGITGTYYFRMAPGSFDEQVIKQIYELGHEIGYHYEDLNRSGVRGPGSGEEVKAINSNNLNHITNGPHNRMTARPQDHVRPDPELTEKAIASFSRNLQKLRELAPVETICMHGSPLSKYDNRMLWEYYDYRDFGIIGEPYFDLNFEEVLYLTDTGRRWDGDSVNIRDKATGDRRRASVEETRYGVWGMGYEETQVLKKEHRIPHIEAKRRSRLGGTAHRTPVLRFHSTSDIIAAAKNDKLPEKLMITIHPQRWDNRPLPWIKELVWQNIKNIGKRIITNKHKSNL